MKPGVRPVYIIFRNFRFFNREFINWWSTGAEGPRGLIGVILEVFTHFNTGGRELQF